MKVECKVPENFNELKKKTQNFEKKLQIPIIIDISLLRPENRPKKIGVNLGKKQVQSA